MDEKPYLSPSQIEMACKCPEAYRRRYIEGERRPPGFAMLRGSGVHGGAAWNFRQKIGTHEDLPRKEIVDAAVSTFETRLDADDVEMTPEEASRGRPVIVSESVATVVRLAGFHADRQAPDYQPRLVEQTVRLSLPGASHDLLGKLDVMTEVDEIVDIKTAGKSKSQADADRSIQLTSYAALAKAYDGTDARLTLDVIVDAKQTKRQVLETTRGPADFRALAARINAVLRMIESGNFPPTTPGAWWCSTRWCGYAATCPYFVAKDNQ